MPIKATVYHQTPTRMAKKKKMGSSQLRLVRMWSKVRFPTLLGQVYIGTRIWGNCLSVSNKAEHMCILLPSCFTPSYIPSRKALLHGVTKQYALEWITAALFVTVKTGYYPNVHQKATELMATCSPNGTLHGNENKWSTSMQKYIWNSENTILSEKSQTQMSIHSLFHLQSVQKDKTNLYFWTIRAVVTLGVGTLTGNDHTLVMLFLDLGAGSMWV